MNDNYNRVIIVDHDGDQWEGVYRVYPGNEESEPESEFQGEFIYTRNDDGHFDSIHDARRAAHSVANRVAKEVGGQWVTNEYNQRGETTS